MSDENVIDYDFFMQQALRYLMRDVLKLVADTGDAPGEHHFYIEFLTGAPGVSVPDHLREEYPERMTIVLQHMFENLTVNDEAFGVTLQFKGKEARLEIPYQAVTSFADPSAQFGLRFEPVAEDASDDAKGVEAKEKTAETAAAPASEAKDETGDDDEAREDADKQDSADIVSLDAFRKK